ncbi:MAG: Tex family protein [Candidatus Zixiibacteriota bacterium]
MPITYSNIIASELNITPEQVSATLSLLDDDATVPFIARYRKELTGSLDEVVITDIRNRIGQLRELDKRREAILKSLEERELLTDELREKILSADTMAVLEDIYLPYKPKRKTRATIAIERGLEPLAEILFEQNDIDLQAIAEKYIDPEKEVETAEDALAGARDIIAGWISEDADIRSKLRHLFADQGIIYSSVISGQENEGNKFADYFDWQEPIKNAPSHRILAMRRGENEGYLKLRILPDEEEAFNILEDMFITADNDAARQVWTAIEDSYRRLLAPSMETEMRNESRITADTEAIRVFTENLRELLMEPPLGQKSVLAIDPGFRTGCKMVCLDKQGKLLENTTIYPHTGENQKKEAAVIIKALINKFKIQLIAIGNGTAGRETEAFIREIGIPEHILIEMVNESGASIYSASAVAREEFPDQDITVRGAVSIGRRIMDPLAELVKIDPKSIGVGQYQHDVDQSLLKLSLDDTVMSCVNAVGVEVNTASRQLLNYVSGLGQQLAQKIIEYRNENGPFKSRKSLLKVPRLGPKAFEQAAGFLRINDAPNPLDRSAVHPESYSVVEKMASDLGCTVDLLIQDESLRGKLNLQDYINNKIGLPTLNDILQELVKPGRDPRAEFEEFHYDDSVHSISDLKIGMKLPGIVTNVTKFGAFVDIGVHQDGLVHISQLADEYIKDPTEYVKVRQKVTVEVIEIDLDRNRISLSMRASKV